MDDDLSPARYIHTTIARPAAEVYEFAHNPANLPEWAAGLGNSIALIDGAWIAPSPLGEIRVEFVADNGLGVLDHTVTLPTGDSIYNPMRVFANGSGSEVVFTLFQLPCVSETAFETDATAVAVDLATLKRILER
jgi:hypothetical protein